MVEFTRALYVGVGGPAKFYESLQPRIPVGCRVAGGIRQPPGLVPCTQALLQRYLKAYESQPDVRAFRRMEQRLRALDLSNAADMQKLTRATAVVVASAGAVTFDELAELLN
jgi:hypothetical protein